MSEIIAVLTGFLTMLVIYNIPLLYGTVGEILVEKSGSLNLGVEGTMAIGAIVGYLVGCNSGSILVGIIAAALSGALCGLLFAVLTVTFSANQNVTGLTITTFGLGFYFVLGNSVKTAGKWPAMFENEAITKGFEGIEIPILSKIPIIGEAFFSRNIFVYLGVIIAVVMWWYMKYTKPGLCMRAVGENPGAADSLGINVTLYKYIHIMVGSAVMGIGGYYMGLNLNGSFEGSNCWINGYGWIAVALVIFANWSPVIALGGTFVFGIFNTLRVYNAPLTDAFPKLLGWLDKIPSQLFEALPFIITAIVLVIDSVRKNKNSGLPAAMGVSYFREDR